MSSVSQTPPSGGIVVRIAVGFVGVAAVVFLAVGGLRHAVLQAAARGRLHAPDLGLVASLPLAIRVHLIAALSALLLGAVLMTVRKGRRFHRVAGWVWVSIVAVTAGSTLFITSLTPGRYSLLHLFTGWTLIVLPLAVMWAKRHEIARHRRNMMGLFYGGFAINLFIAMIPGRTLWSVFFG
jgi:uncharacterized membrane protein